MTAQNEQNKLWEAIGMVATASADLAHQLEMMVVAVSGTELVSLSMYDAPMGAQVKQAESIVRACNTNRYLRHPAVADEDKASGLALVGYAGRCAKYRNRVIHDSWHQVKSADYEDAIQGRRPARFSHVVIEARVRSFYYVTHSMNAVSAGLSATVRAIYKSRNASGPGDDAATSRREAQRQVRRADEMLTGMGNGTLEHWLWREVKQSYGTD